MIGPDQLYFADIGAALVTLFVLAIGTYTVLWHNATAHTLHAMRRPVRLKCYETPLTGYVKEYLRRTEAEMYDGIRSLLTDVCEQSGVPLSPQTVCMGNLLRQKVLEPQPQAAQVRLDIRSLVSSGRSGTGQPMSLKVHGRRIEMKPMQMNSANRSDVQSLSRLDEQRLPFEGVLLAALAAYTLFFGTRQEYLLLGPLVIMMFSRWSMKDFAANRKFLEGTERPSIVAFQWDPRKDMAVPKSGSVQLFLGAGPAPRFFLPEFIIRWLRLGSERTICCGYILKAVAELGIKGHINPSTALAGLYFLYNYLRIKRSSGQLIQDFDARGLTVPTLPSTMTDFVPYVLLLVRSAFMWSSFLVGGQTLRADLLDLGFFYNMAYWVCELIGGVGSIFSHNADVIMEGFTHEELQTPLGIGPALDCVMAETGLVYSPLVCAKNPNLRTEPTVCARNLHQTGLWNLQGEDPKVVTWPFLSYVLLKWIAQETQPCFLCTKLTTGPTSFRDLCARRDERFRLVHELARDFFYFRANYAESWPGLHNPFYVAALRTALQRAATPLGYQANYREIAQSFQKLSAFVMRRYSLKVRDLTSFAYDRNKNFRAYFAQNYARFGSHTPEATLVIAMLTSCPQSIIKSALDPQRTDEDNVLLLELAKLLKQEPAEFQQALSDLKVVQRGYGQHVQQVHLVIARKQLSRQDFDQLGLTRTEALMDIASRKMLGRGTSAALQ